MEHIDGLIKETVEIIN